MQPDPKLFYKTFLELDFSNLVTILSFDSGSLSVILNADNKEYFNPQYPIIYTTRVQKKQSKNFYYTNAIGNALKNNQVRAVTLLIDYIINFQNNYTSSFLFRFLLPEILEKGISVQNLLDSNVFSVVFDFDEWPANHFNDEYTIRPYNDSYFKIRYHY